MASVPPIGPPGAQAAQDDQDDQAAQDDQDELVEPAGRGPRYGDDLPAGVAMGPGGEIVFRPRPPAADMVGSTG